MTNIQRSLSTKLSIVILLLSIPIFLIVLGVLYNQSRRIIRTEAVGRANSVLNTTLQHISRNISAIETATNSNDWLILKYLQPDSLLNLTHRIVQVNSHVDGCSISTEPDVFPQYGRYFSAYSIREKTANGTDSVTTVIEEQYEYFDKIWYKTPRDLKKACWVDFFDDVDSLEVTLSGMISSYCKPIYDTSGRLVAVISTDLSMERLSKHISQEKPYPNSYFMMVDKEGHFFIHPDTTRLFKETIFSGVDPRTQSELITLGYEMTKGNKGSMSVIIDGVPSIVCYQPVPGASWSLALVCPDSDVLAGYHKLSYILGPLFIIGLLAFLLLCYRSVAHTIRPINTLLDKTQSITEGNMEIHIPQSQREDAVGRLQNSFATMLRFLQFHMGSVRYTTEQTRQRNEELVEATRLAEEADHQKVIFIQNVSHQIRTPLNIIMGFAQVLNDGSDVLPEEERKFITNTMSYNARLLNRMVLMLFDSSDTGLSEELLRSAKHDTVPCNEVVREAISYIKIYYPDVNITLNTEYLDDSFIHTSRLYLMRSLREILYNSAKYSDGKHISIFIADTPTSVRFIVQDTGKGIAEADRDRMFKFFTKIDDLSEGLGLGLPLSKRHARNLGGDLYLDEDYHAGCRFILEIPQDN